MNGAVKQITGGYTTEDLVEVRREATGQMDKSTGKEIFKTVYALKYPETVIPPVNESVDSDYDKVAESFQQSETESAAESQNEEPEGMAASDEPAGEETSEEVNAEDPFAGLDADVDPFNP
jgi:hypothetical protein